MTTQQMNRPSQLELVNWCKGESIDLKHALLLYGVLEGVSRDEIEETARTIKALGKVVVKGKMFNSQLQSLMVLCECREEINPMTIPPEIMPISGGSGWKAVYYIEPQPDDFEGKLLTFLQNEGKTLEDIQGLHTHGGEVDGNSEAIIRAVGELIVRTNKQPESHPYRRLRTFSGVSPTPAGKEALDIWLEQATLLVEEGECSDKEKRRCIANPADDRAHIRRPVARAHCAQKSQAVKLPDPVEESDTASSDEMFEAVHNPQSFGVQEVRRQLATPHQTLEKDDTSEEEHFEAAESQPVGESENSSGDDTPTMLEYDAQETNESMGEQEEERETGSPFSNRTQSDNSHRSTRNESEQFSTSQKSLRKPKPPMRLTYEKPGHPFCEPVTIMHHGMVIQLKLNPPDISEPKGRSKTSKKFLGSEEDHHPVKLKRSQRCR